MLRNSGTIGPPKKLFRWARESFVDKTLWARHLVLTAHPALFPPAPLICPSPPTARSAVARRSSQGRRRSRPARRGSARSTDRLGKGEGKGKRDASPVLALRERQSALGRGIPRPFSPSGRERQSALGRGMRRGGCTPPLGSRLQPSRWALRARSEGSVGKVNYSREYYRKLFPTKAPGLPPDTGWGENTSGF